MRIFRKLVDNGHEERWSVSGVERRDIYQSRFPRKFISRTFSTYAFSNAVKVGLARARACATSASCCVLRVSSTTRTRAFSFNFSISYPDISFYRPPRVTSKFLSREEKEKEKKKKKKRERDERLFEKFEKKLCGDCSWNDHVSAPCRTGIIRFSFGVPRLERRSSR